MKLPTAHGVALVLRLALPGIGLTVMLAALVVGSEAARGQTPWYEGFEGAQTSWRPAGGDVHFQILAHRRVRGQACTGQACEHVAISAASGTHVYFSHDVGRPRVIEELLPTVQVRSDRPGIQLLARVVLPRTRDPRTGAALSTLVHGSSYASVGRWEQLRIDAIPEQLARRTRVLRAELGPDIDPREAYVEQILLNVYGGPGVTNVWIDDLDISGHVGSQPGMADWSAPPGPNASAATIPTDPAGWRGSGSDRAGSPPSRHIQWDGSLLLVDGRPFFPRIIQYQGESLALLERLGFNTIWLEELPSSPMLDESSRLGLWLVCPPPRPLQPGGPSDRPVALAPIGPRYERVLAWDLGRDLTAKELDAVKQWAEQVRAADRQVARPLICRPKNSLRSYSRPVDILMIGRAPLGTSLALSDHGTWLRQRPRLARPGKPIWTTVQTQIAPGIRRQWNALGLPEPPPATPSSEQIRLLTYTAVTAGVRGLLFESYAPLDAPDPANRHRARALELLNLELALIEPWLAAGDLVTTLDASEPEVVGSVLRTDRAQLLVPIWSGPGAQFVPGQLAGRGVTLVVPGVPDSNNAYLLAPGALEPLRDKRVTGGTRVTLDEFGLTSLVLLTGESRIVSAVTRRAAQIGRRAAQLQRDLAAAKFQAVEQVQRQLSPQTGAARQSAVWLDAALRAVQQSDASLAAGQYPDAYRHAQRAMRPLRLLERAQWHSAVELLPSVVSHPAAVSFATLPGYWRSRQRIASVRPGPNLLPAGGFEDLDTILRAGWQHFRSSSDGIVGEAELSATAAHSGQHGLRLVARPVERDRSDVLVESPPSSITSPPVNVEAGQLVRIHGWVRVPAPIRGSVDGLLIIESLAGEPLAERVYTTGGWREFTLYRVAPERGELAVTFALSGLGEAWIDDVTIQPITAGPTGPAPTPPFRSGDG